MTITVKRISEKILLTVFFFEFAELFVFGVYRLKKSMIFTKKKYLYLLLIISLLILGFILMSGGTSSDPNIFSNDIFSFRRITLAPLIVIGSYIGLIWLILTKSAN